MKYRMNKEKHEIEKIKKEKEKIRNKFILKFKRFILPNFVKTIIIIIFMVLFFLNLQSLLYISLKVSVVENYDI